MSKHEIFKGFICNKWGALNNLQVVQKIFFRVTSFQGWNKIPQENMNPPMTVKPRGLFVSKEKI